MGPLKTQASKMISMLEIEYIMFIWGWYIGGIWFSIKYIDLDGRVTVFNLLKY